MSKTLPLHYVSSVVGSLPGEGADGSNNGLAVVLAACPKAAGMKD